MRSQGCNADGCVISSMYIEHDPVDTDTPGPSLTRQEFADECDINTIMARYETTGILPSHQRAGDPQYLDLSDVPDLRTSIDLMRDAESAFMRLPATIRREFDNDPVRFVEFAQNPQNLEKMREWGLAPPLPQKPDPTEVVILNPEPPEAAK